MLLQRLLARWFSVVLLDTVLAGCGTPVSGSPTPAPAVTPPVGKQLLMGGALTMRGMTSDGWAVYSDNDTLTLHAVSIAGGAARDIVPLGISFAISVWGKDVFAWSNKNTAAVGLLTVWTSAGGPRALSSASLAPWVAATVDGGDLLYLDDGDAEGQNGDLFAAAGDGSSPRVILQALTGLQNDGCQALLGFAGSHALAAHCDGGATQATISSFAMPSWKRVDLATGAADAWSNDQAGTVVLTATKAGTVLLPIDGGPGTTIDPSGGTGVLVANGQSAIYGAATNELRRSRVLSPSPTTLVGSGVEGLYAVSPDEMSVLFYNNMDTVHLISEMYLTSAVTAGTPITLSATPTAAVHGDPFTSDSSHALYSTEVDAVQQTGTLNALAIGGGAPRVLARDAWEVWAATGAKVVFSDNYAWTGQRVHTDVLTIDTSQSAEPTLIVYQADSEVFLSPALDQIVYTWSLDDGPQGGIYVANLP
jgi:hypothetical protein